MAQRDSSLVWHPEGSALLLLLHPSPHDGVKQHLKRSFGLGAMLHAEAEHHDLAFALSETYHRCLAFQALGPVRVAGDQDVLSIVGIPGDHRALNVGSRCGRYIPAESLPCILRGSAVARR